MNRTGTPGRKGFTLIELIVVVAVIGLLSAIVVPKFGQMIEKAREAADKGALGSMRSALSIYYVDNEGFAVRDLDALYEKYLSTTRPYWRPRPHPYSIRGNHPLLVFPGISNAFIVGNSPLDSFIQSGGDDGAWLYRVNGLNAFSMVVNCTHTDLRGDPWSGY